MTKDIAFLVQTDFFLPWIYNWPEEWKLYHILRYLWAISNSYPCRMALYLYQADSSIHLVWKKIVLSRKLNT